MGVRLCADEEGQALLEVTVSLTILLTVMLAIFQLGIIYNAQIMITQAAGTSVQYLSSLSSLAASEGITDPCASTISNFKTDAPNLNSSQLTVTVSLGGGAATTTCTVAQLQAVTTVQVNANYTCSFVIPGTSFSGCHVTANPSMTVIQ
jgi:Flp pilus assembly protein TadG